MRTFPPAPKYDHNFHKGNKKEPARSLAVQDKKRWEQKMKKYEFYQLDVFTEKKFKGNPLAVFTNAVGISDEEMQKIANEMNLSETVFVLPSDKALRRLRIFTPKQELPLAGHPVVGTWNLLANLGITPQIKNGDINIEQEVLLGVLPVNIEFCDGKPLQITMTQGSFERFEMIENEEDIKKLAEGLGLERKDLIQEKNSPIQVVSTGIKSLVVPLRSLDTLSRCQINSSLLSKIYLKYEAVGVYVWTTETKEKESSFHARFFAPDDNIPEDPATGSAAGSFSGYVIHYGITHKNKFVIEQGDFMNRPSRIYAEITGEKGNVEKVQIGGRSIIVAKGEVYLD